MPQLLIAVLVHASHSFCVYAFTLLLPLLLLLSLLLLQYRASTAVHRG
jgi:hypothetical protein